jgi:hypothetical protein
VFKTGQSECSRVKIAPAVIGMAASAAAARRKAAMKTIARADLLADISVAAHASLVWEKTRAWWQRLQSCSKAAWEVKP